MTNARPTPHDQSTQEYIDSSDPTLLCSRDGHLALRAFLRLSQLGGWQGLAAMARRAVGGRARGLHGGAGLR